MSAEILRKAAALMRERVTAATFDDEGNFLGFAHRECDEHRTVGPHRAWCYDCGEWCYPEGPCPRCSVLTSMEFTVAVADVLALAADHVDGRGSACPSCVEYVETVARAYLGDANV